MIHRVAVRVLKRLVGVIVASVCVACSGAHNSAPSSAENPRVYVSNEMDGTVSVVDPVERRVISTIQVGKRPRGIRVSPDGQSVFVALSGSPMAGPGVDESTLPPPERQHDGIGVIDVKSGRLTRVLKGGTDPEQFAISADGKRMFVANEDAGQVTVLDIGSGEVVRTIPVGGEPEGVDRTPDGRFVYVTSEADNQVFVIDAERLDVSKIIDVGSRPRASAFLADHSRAFVSAENEPAVYVIDTRTHGVEKKIVFDGPALRPMGVVTAPDNRYVYVTTGRGGDLLRIDAASNAVAGSLPVGERPWGVAISRDGRMLVTANGPSNDVTVVNAVSWTITGRVRVGERPWGAVFLR
jgi:YVTN family beta-propeller protein